MINGRIAVGLAALAVLVWTLVIVRTRQRPRRLDSHSTPEALDVPRTGNGRFDRIVPQVVVATGTMGVLIILGILRGLGPYAVTSLVWSGTTALVWSGVPAPDRAIATVRRAAGVGGLVSGAISLLVWEGAYGRIAWAVIRIPYDNLVSVVVPIGIGLGLAVGVPSLIVARRMGGVSTAVPAAVATALAATMTQALAQYAKSSHSFNALDGDGATAVTGAAVAGFVGGLALVLDRGRGIGRASLLGMANIFLSVVVGLVIAFPEGFGFALGLALPLIIVPGVMVGGISALIGACLGTAVSAARPGRSTL
jgi:hypothetical protein